MSRTPIYSRPFSDALAGAVERAAPPSFASTSRLLRTAAQGPRNDTRALIRCIGEEARHPGHDRHRRSFEDSLVRRCEATEVIEETQDHVQVGHLNPCQGHRLRESSVRRARGPRRRVVKPASVTSEAGS
jgi:hypothetical protein